MIELDTPDDLPNFFSIPTAAQVLRHNGLSNGGRRPLYRDAKAGELKVVRINGRDLRTCALWLQEYAQRLVGRSHG